MWIRVTVNDNLTVQNAEADTVSGPFSICKDVNSRFERLKGLKITSGWRKAVFREMGGAVGCVHLNDLLIGPIAVAASHTVLKSKTSKKTSSPSNHGSNIINSCYAFSEDSPVVKRELPNFFKQS